MTFPHRFTTLVEIDPPTAPAVAPPNAETPFESAELIELARQFRRVIQLTKSPAPPWRPRTMEEWLT